MTTLAINRIEVEADADGLRAWIVSSDSRGAPETNREEIEACLTTAGIPLTEAVRNRVEQFLKHAAAGDADTRFLIAEGRPPVPPRDGAFERVNFAAAAEPPSEVDGQADAADAAGPIIVAAEEVVGRIVAPEPGRPGEDVFGRPIPAGPAPQPAALQAGVRVLDDGCTVATTMSGRLEHSERSAVVREIRVIDGDVQVQAGPVDVEEDVVVRGSVLDGASVTTRGSLFILGAVESAVLEAANDITVGGGIVGKQKGRARCGGRLTARFCTDADIQAGLDVRIATQALHSRIRAGRCIIVRDGAVVGGEAVAESRVEVRALGNPSGAETVVRVGMTPETADRIRRLDLDIQKKTAAADRVRELVKPLLANMRRLRPQQREQATELMFKAETLESEAQSMRTDRLRLVGTEADEPSVTVGEQVLAGVTVCMVGLSTRFKSALQGPARIVRRRIDGSMQLAAENESTGAVAPLPTTRHANDAAPDLSSDEGT